MAEGARLESVYTLTRIEGSNPSLSAKHSCISGPSHPSNRLVLTFPRASIVAAPIQGPHIEPSTLHSRYFPKANFAHSVSG